MDLEPIQWVVLGAAALLVGIAKGGVPGIGILAPVIAVLVMQGREAHSVGLMLPILIVGDLFALSYHRRHAEWKHLLRALPWALCGLVVGFLCFLLMQHLQIDINAVLKRTIGIIVLSVLVVSEWLRRRRARSGDVAISRWLAPALGLIGGIATMLANAAGPIFACYLLALSLPKRNFMGTSAWLFFILNMVKVPFHVYLKYITVDSLLFNLKMVPLIGAGAVVGILLFRIIPERAFRIVVMVLTIAACLKLLLP